MLKPSDGTHLRQQRLQRRRQRPHLVPAVRVEPLSVRAPLRDEPAVEVVPPERRVQAHARRHPRDELVHGHVRRLQRGEEIDVRSRRGVYRLERAVVDAPPRARVLVKLELVQDAADERVERALLLDPGRARERGRVRAVEVEEKVAILRQKRDVLRARERPVRHLRHERGRGGHVRVVGADGRVVEETTRGGGGGLGRRHVDRAYERRAAPRD
eukprot:30891-Pelagococcus_subviridis.AAC.14